MDEGKHGRNDGSKESQKEEGIEIELEQILFWYDHLNKQKVKCLVSFTENKELSYVLKLSEYVTLEFTLSPPSHFEFSITLFFSMQISIH